MNVRTQVFAGLTTVTPVVVLFHPRVELPGFTRIEPGNEGAVRRRAINVGIYDLTDGLDPFAGLILLRTGQAEAGRGLDLFGCAAHSILGIVRCCSGRVRWTGALLRSTPPLIAVAAYLTWDRKSCADLSKNDHGSVVRHQRPRRSLAVLPPERLVSLGWGDNSRSIGRVWSRRPTWRVQPGVAGPA